jgi:hypothetical protein
LRSAPVSEGLDNDVGDDGGGEVTHAAAQGACRPLAPPLTTSAVATAPQSGGCSRTRPARASQVSRVATFCASSLTTIVDQEKSTRRQRLRRVGTAHATVLIFSRHAGVATGPEADSKAGLSTVLAALRPGRVTPAL